MTLMTSAGASKLLRKLQEEKQFWLEKESNEKTYQVIQDEEPIIPDYDYKQVSAKIAEIDDKVLIIKHAINLSNAMNTIEVEGETFTIDQVLIRMAQLTNRRACVDRMRREQPKSRLGVGMYSARKAAPEYCYINYDLSLVQADYERLDDYITKMQIALDRYNQTVEFEVGI